MKNFVSILSLVFILLSVCSFAQDQNTNNNQTLEFEKNEHDFGDIKADDGSVTHVFSFKNTGGAPIILQNVKASCGCTTPNWPRKPINSGEKGEITVTFNPKGRKGTFRKSITITANAKNSPVKLYITGLIVERERTMEEIYPVNLDGFRVKSQYVNMNRIKNTQTKTSTIDFVNLNDEDIKVEFDDVKPHFTVKAIPETVKPKEKGKLEITYDAGKKNEWDYVTDKFFVKVNGKTLKGTRQGFTIGATIQMDFSHLSNEEKENAPKLEIENSRFDFKTINQGDKVTHVYKFKNIGKSDLEILKVKTNCECIVADLNTKTIKPGETGEITAVFDSKGKRGRQYKTVTMITNSPSNAKVVFAVVGQVNPK